MLPYSNSLNNGGLPNSQSMMHSILPSAIQTTSSLPSQLASITSINSSLNQTLSSSIIPTTIGSSLSKAIDSSSLLPTLNPTLNTSSIHKPACTVTRSSMNSTLCKSPTATKNELYSIQPNLIQTSSQSMLPVNQILKASTSTLNNNLNLTATLTPSLTNSLSVGLPSNAMNTFSSHSNGQSHQSNGQSHQSNGNENDHMNFNSNSPICMTNVLKDCEIQKLTNAAKKLIASLNEKIGKNLKTKNRKNLKTVEVSFDMS